MKFFVRTINLISYFIIIPLTASAQPVVPICVSEPLMTTQLSWDITQTGLLIVNYDRDGNGKADFHTLRVIARNYRSTDNVFRMGKNYPDQWIFFVKYNLDRHYYIAAKMPLFYGFDMDEDGHWDLLYKDALEDGVNGNERFYESPSGMFADAFKMKGDFQ